MEFLDGLEEKMNYKIFPSQVYQSGSSTTVDDFVRQRERSLKTKLEVFAFQILERLALRRIALKRIDKEEQSISSELEAVEIGINYHRRSRSEAIALNNQALNLRREIREQDVDCWRDIVKVMRDFLSTWEGHEEAKMRHAILNDR